MPGENTIQMFPTSQQAEHCKQLGVGLGFDVWSFLKKPDQQKTIIVVNNVTTAPLPPLSY